MPIDPEAAGSQIVINEAFVSQAYPQKRQMGGHQGIHEFLYILECSVPLLGRDLLSKLGTQVTFPPMKDPHFEWAQPPIYSSSR